MIGGSQLIPAAAAVGALAGRTVEFLGQNSPFAALLTNAAPDTDGASSASKSSEVAPELNAAGNQPESEIRRLEALRQNLKRLEQQVVDQLRTKLAANSEIDMSDPIVLGVHSSGRVLEMSGHRDRALIEQLLENDPELSNQIKQLLEQTAAIEPSLDLDTAMLEPRLVMDEPRSIFQVV